MDQRVVLLWRKSEKHLRKIVFGVFVALLVGVFFIYRAESSAIRRAPDAPAPTPMPGSNEAIEELHGLLNEPAPPLGQSEFSYLAEVSMFDTDGIEEARAAEEQADQVVSQARVLFEQEKYEEALAALEPVFAEQPMHFGAYMLREEIDAILNPEPTPAPEAPAGGAMGPGMMGPGGGMGPGGMMGPGGGMAPGGGMGGPG